MVFVSHTTETLQIMHPSRSVTSLELAAAVCNMNYMDRAMLVTAAYLTAAVYKPLAMQGALNSMHTPGVLTFLHLLTAAILQLVLAAWQVVETPQISAKAAKGGSLLALLNGLQVRSV
jgi:hypothetical protein